MPLNRFKKSFGALLLASTLLMTGTNCQAHQAHLKTKAWSLDLGIVRIVPVVTFLPIVTVPFLIIPSVKENPEYRGFDNLLWGRLYNEGFIGIPQDSAKAAEYYQKAAGEGNAEAQMNLGFLYDVGRGVPQNYEKAAEYYQKAANQGDAAAQCNLGILYENGQGVPQNYEKAAEYYQKAADQKNANAQYHLGLLYENGQGVSKNHEKAIELWHKAANQGQKKAKKALENLTSGVQDAQTVSPAPKKEVSDSLGDDTIPDLTKKADAGERDAQLMLGLLYVIGEGGVPQDIPKGIAYLQKAADQGDSIAQVCLGLVYQVGAPGVPKNEIKALDIFLQALKQAGGQEEE
ncbi:sel1 repeat family protein [Acetobacteraceae bacterium]|nr:sel1 repeat family protein [Acetobacteraceae bacterium]